MSLVEAFGEILEPADVHVAQRLTALASETDESVELAIALAVRALRGGSVCGFARGGGAGGYALAAVARCR